MPIRGRLLRSEGPLATILDIATLLVFVLAVLGVLLFTRVNTLTDETHALAVENQMLVEDNIVNVAQIQHSNCSLYSSIAYAGNALPNAPVIGAVSIPPNATSSLGIVLIITVREKYTEAGCSPYLPPPSVNLDGWAAYYGLTIKQ
jgi:hypothetical protein